MCSLGDGVSAVEAGFSVALDIEEVLVPIGSCRLHVLVADVIKSFDTVDRCKLDCTLGRLGLRAWFWKLYFAGLGEPWCRDGGIPPGLLPWYGFYCCPVCALV